MQSSRCRTDNLKKLAEKRIVAENIFVGIGRKQPVAIKSHRRASLTINMASSRDLSKIERFENGQTLPCDVYFPEKWKLKEAHNDLALFYSGMHKIKVTVGTKPTLTYPIVSLFDTRAAPYLINASFIKSQ